MNLFVFWLVGGWVSQSKFLKNDKAVTLPTHLSENFFIFLYIVIYINTYIYVMDAFFHLILDPYFKHMITSNIFEPIFECIRINNAVLLNGTLIAFPYAIISHVW